MTYIIKINFDDASYYWRKNMISMANGCFIYKKKRCEQKTLKNKKCKNIVYCDGKCKIHFKMQNK